MEVVKEFVIKGYADANFDTNPDFPLKNTFQITLHAFQKFYIISDQQYVNNIYSSKIL